MIIYKEQRINNNNLSVTISSHSIYKEEIKRITIQRDIIISNIAINDPLTTIQSEQTLKVTVSI
jgi:hypothetical protein